MQHKNLDVLDNNDAICINICKKYEDYTMSNNPENRKYKRIERRYTARFRIRSDEAREAKSEDWNSITLMNLSTGGTLFYYTKDLGIGTLLDLQIDVSRFAPGINCIGKIIRIYEIESISMFGTAVKFIDIGVKEEAMINTIVEEALE